jgi:hypothetical protein
MSHGQHCQSNSHPKSSTRGERLLSKIGLRFRRVSLKRLERELYGRRSAQVERLA